MLASAGIAGFVHTPVRITGMTADSRRVLPGFLFAALPGAHADGRKFIADAVASWCRGGAGTLGHRLAARRAAPAADRTSPNRAARSR